MATKDKSTASTLLENEGLFAMAAGSGSGGSGNNGIGGGGGSPGGGTPGGGGGNGGGNGGKPGGEAYGNNLSFPAIFFDDGAPTLRGTMGEFVFTEPTYLTGAEYADYVYFAQGVEGNTWQAGNYATTVDVVVDYVDIGDALESAPIKAGTNVRLELTLYEELDSPLTAFAMTVLGGAKGEGKPTVKGPTESQGARLQEDLWDGTSYDSTTGTPPDPLTPTTYASEFASVYAANAGEGEKDVVDSYMTMTVQRVTGVAAEADLAKLHWDGTQWSVQSGNPEVTVGENLANTAFGPELNIAGKYIMGASGKPFKFTSDGDYLITFALEDGTPVSFDATTKVANDIDPAALGFQPPDPYELPLGRETWVVADPGGGPDDTHNGLLVMLVGVPSSGDSGGEGE